MKNNHSLEMVENLYALARSFVCDPSRIIDTQDGFLIHSSWRTHLSFSNLLLFNIVFSHSLYFSSCLSLHAIFVSSGPSSTSRHSHRQSPQLSGDAWILRWGYSSKLFRELPIDWIPGGPLRYSVRLLDQQHFAVSVLLLGSCVIRPKSDIVGIFVICGKFLGS